MQDFARVYPGFQQQELMKARMQHADVVRRSSEIPYTRQKDHQQPLTLRKSLETAPKRIEQSGRKSAVKESPRTSIDFFVNDNLAQQAKQRLSRNVVSKSI